MCWVIRKKLPTLINTRSLLADWIPNRPYINCWWTTCQQSLSRFPQPVMTWPAYINCDISRLHLRPTYDDATVKAQRIQSSRRMIILGRRLAQSEAGFSCWHISAYDYDIKYRTPGEPLPGWGLGCSVDLVTFWVTTGEPAQRHTISEG